MSQRPQLTPIIVAGIVIVLLAGAYWWLRQVLSAPAPDNGTGSVEVEIPRGASLDAVARQLEERHLIRDRSRFKWAARIMRADRKLQPGRFLLPHGAGNSEIIRFLLRPGVETVDITIPEGLTARQIAGIVKRELQLDSLRFVIECEDSLLAAELGVPAARLEGYLYPDTYNFYLGDNERAVIRRMVGRFNEEFNDSLQGRLPKVGLSMHEAVTLASIIQGEVMVASEAGKVSAVYHNRLKKRLRLGADPTIQYILPDGPRRLLLPDLQIDSPYNTYTHYGLPPGPINNPGVIALKAAVNPTDVDYIYFVARGDGTHAFNSTAAGHERDKAKFQQVRREVARKKKAAEGG